MVHRSTYAPLDNPVIVEVGEVAAEKVGAVPKGPDTIVHAPLPLVAAFPAIVMRVAGITLH
jgi:hypothetical protein